MFYSVVKHAGSGDSTKEVWGEHEPQASVSPYFLSPFPTCVVTVKVRLAETTGDRHYSERTHSPCKFLILLFGHFYINKARLQKRRQLIGFFLSLFCMYSVISASVINIAVY